MHAQSALMLTLGLHGSSGPILNCSESAISAILPSYAKLTYAVAVQVNGTWHKPSPAFPFPSTGLPELCAISVNVVSSASSSFNFGLFLPLEWNSRFMASGNGGFGGGLNWNDMGTNAMNGFASMSTDTGHISEVFNATWALHKPESQIDWGHRAMHGSVELAKAITQKYYGSKIKYSYYSACSTGGRQGLKEVQMYPKDFDGVIAAAPAWWTSHLQPWSLEVGLWNLPVDAANHIPGSLFPVIRNEVLRQCDPQDGLTDGIISNPDRCEFHAEALLCGPSSTHNECLTAPQLKTLYKLYHDWTETNNTFMFPHYPYGAEEQYWFVVNTDSGRPGIAGTTYLDNFLLNNTDPDYDWLSNFDHSMVQLAEKLDPGQATADDFDLSPFAARGGKLIHYHGYSDGLIPSGSSTYFYKQVLAALVPKGVSVPDFYKFYLVPGMLHCYRSVGDAPWYFGGGSQPFVLGPEIHTVPGFADPKHDVLLALMDWVEKGIPPEELIATKFVDDKVEKGVKRQRPICPYPERAVYDGKGDPDAAESWSCRGLYGAL